MGGCRCSYKNCKSATKTTENLHFFHYPVKHTERCRKWIENACKPQFFDLAEDQLRNKVVCELHFEERSFTNVSRRRLLHDAIPTLDAGAEVEISQPVEYHNHVQTEEIQVLPANEDGTLFTVDTEFQQLPVSEKIESYIYNDGTLVPLYKTEPPNVEESVVYTVEETNVDHHQPRNVKSKNGNMLLKTTAKNVQPRTYRLVFDNYDGSTAMEEDANNSATRQNQPVIQKLPKIGSNNLEVGEVLPKKAKNIQVVDTRVVQRVKQHTKEIALLKKTLKTTLIQNRPKSKKFVLSTLATLLPPTLYSLVRRTIIKGEVDVTDQDLELFKEIYTASPSLYKSLREKHGWNLPTAIKF